MRKMIVAVAMALGLMVQGVQANVAYVFGKIDSVSAANSYFKVGDAVMFKINYSSPGGVGGAVSRANVTIDGSVYQFVRTNDTSVFNLDENPADGTIQWVLSTGNTGNHFDVASNTPGGVIPCIDNFDLGRSFQVEVNGYTGTGTVLAKPITRTGQ